MMPIPSSPITVEEIIAASQSAGLTGTEVIETMLRGEEGSALRMLMASSSSPQAAEVIETMLRGDEGSALSSTPQMMLASAVAASSSGIADTMIQNVTDAAEKKAAEVAATLASEAKNHLPLALSICCGALCCSLFGVLVLAAHITAFVGLAHTQRADLDPLCPAHYRDGQLALLFLRWIAFGLGGGAMFCLATKGTKSGLFYLCASCCALTTILSLTIADTTVTAQAWAALNCTEAIRAASHSADPVLPASGALFVLIDWLLLLACCGCAAASARFNSKVAEEA